MPATSASETSSALDRTRELLREGVTATVRDGYLDTLDAGVPAASTVAQQAMRWPLLPKIYEAVWRPVGFTLGSAGRGTAAEQRVIDAFLDLQTGDRVLDVACGPGNTTRRLMAGLGAGGLAVGLDAAPAMLRRAVADTHDPRAAYVLGDGGDLPFADGTFDAVTCLGALYLIDDPHEVMAQLARVLAPGGRLVVLTSCNRGPLPLGALVSPGGMRVFGRDEVTGRFAALGLRDIRQDVSGFLQIVGGRR